MTTRDKKQRPNKSLRVFNGCRIASGEISAKYDRFARSYDWIEGIPDLLGVGRLRRSLFSRVSGAVLEVAVGTGKNFPYYPPGCRITAVDVSREMLNIARKRAAKLSMDISFSLVERKLSPCRLLLRYCCFLAERLHISKSGSLVSRNGARLSNGRQDPFTGARPKRS
jgi:SAM-dependent methyltransferase